MPIDSIPTEQFHVDPDVQYIVQSKKFIGEIDVAQAKIIDKFQSPCVVKATHGTAGEAVFFVKTEEDFHKAMENLHKIPHCQYIITELISDVIMTYCAHFYITKKGEVQWIGACEEYLVGSKSHGKTENIMKMGEQDVLKPLLFPLCETVGQALHKEGYFGYCGSDIVIDKNKQAYVVDVNARVTGSSTLILSSILMNKKKGYTVSSYRRPIVFERKIPLEELIERLENIENGIAVLVFSFPYENGTGCGIRVYSHSEEMCEDIYAQIDGSA